MTVAVGKFVIMYIHVCAPLIMLRPPFKAHVELQVLLQLLLEARERYCCDCR